MGCGPAGGPPAFDPFGGYGHPAPYFAQPQPQPARQPVQPKLQPVAVKPPPKPAPKPVSAVVVLTPEQLGIRLDDAPVVVPMPGEFGIDLK